MNRTSLVHIPVDTRLTICSRLPAIESVLDRRYCLDNLPLEIKLNIISRLPVESVLDCRLVCKPWANFLGWHNNPNFVNMHLRHENSGITSFVVFIKNHRFKKSNADGNKEPYCGMFYVDDCKGLHCLTIRRINLRLEYSVCGIVGSCNGLICLSHEFKYNNYYYTESKPIYICNPITREHVNLPISINNNNQKNCSVLGFGYHPVTNEYKVIWISYPRNSQHPHPSEGHVEVYTLGSGSGWRNIGETKYNLLNYADQASICVNGSLYWISKISSLAITFDLAAEEFCSVDTQINGEFRLLGITKSAEVLFQHRQSGSLSGYNPKTQTATPIKLCDWNYVIADEEMIWHVNSFVSLKALGEANVRTFIG